MPIEDSPIVPFKIKNICKEKFSKKLSLIVKPQNKIISELVILFRLRRTPVGYLIAKSLKNMFVINLKFCVFLFVIKKMSYKNGLQNHLMFLMMLVE